MEEIISRAIVLGMSLQMRIHSPKDDEISMSQAARYLGSIGFRNPMKILKEYQSQGQIHIHKPHGADNRKARISLCEINTVILENEVRRKIYHIK